MKDEVRSGINFLSEVLLRSPTVNEEQVQKFKDALEQLITSKFENHWHPNKPLRGNAFRCINIEETAIDPVLLEATKASGIPPALLLQMFPGGLALWIDPGEVSCRIGKGSICPLYGQKDLPSSEQNATPNHHQPLQPLFFNSNFRKCSQSSYSQSLFPRYRNNKENYERYHWVSRNYSKRTTEVF